jgi:DNA-binding CsgD family transcriptional regulator
MSSDEVSGPLDLSDATPADSESARPAIDQLFAQMAEALDRMQQGTVLVGGDARIQFANRHARDLLTAADGIHSAPDGLRAETPEQTQTLRRLIREAARPEGLDGASGMMAIRRRFKPRPLAIMVTSCHPRTRRAEAIRPQRAVLVFITDPDRTPTMRSDLLRQLYRLTRMEAEVALAVLRGEGLKAIAGSFGVSMSTARTHLQNVFDKTETRRQAELVYLLLRSLPDVHMG